MIADLSRSGIIIMTFMRAEMKKRGERDLGRFYEYGLKLTF